ncbi:MAG: chemotaxis protein CheW [Desulfovibrionaceae bacterium]|nr:chemotaxis protein CheW [Desulfovibrionaceae bacterium]
MHDEGFSELSQLVTFSIGDEEYGVGILRVQEIIRMMPVTKVPSCPDFVEGVINLRGMVIPVVDMRKRFEMPAKPFDVHTRILVMESEIQVMGYIVDSVREVMRIDPSRIEAAPTEVAGVGSEYIKGMVQNGNKLLILLDLNDLLSESEKGALAAI